MFSSWRTLPGKSNCISRASAASVMRLASTPSSLRALLQEEARPARACPRAARAAPAGAGGSRSGGGTGLRGTRPACTRSSRFWCVAAITRTLALQRAGGRRRGRTGRRDSTRSSRVCRSNGMSPISSRNSVPPSACSKRPRRVVCAPVKAPRSWPNSSLSSRSFGIAAVLMATNGPLRARAVLVQRVRDQFLAGAALAGDQHRDVALAQPADGAEHVLHRRRLAEHLGHLRLRARRAPPRAGSRRRARRISSTALRHVEGLGQVLEGAALEGRDGAVEVGVGRHDDHRQAGQALLDLGQQVDARAAGHADVATPAPAARRRRARPARRAGW